LRLICTSSESESPSVKSAFCTFPPCLSTPTSSPKVCRHQSLWSLGPVLMFVVLPVPTAGECWNVIRLVGLPIWAPHLAYM
jgi:hypothetical protein